MSLPPLLFIFILNDPNRLQLPPWLAELAAPGPAQALARLRALAAAGPVTLLTATREVDISQAAVLADVLREAK